ncbi:MAG: aldehyde dehydrogenase family protein, partial [Pyrinomonadaceae bacterium]|nr:aldehyde dehydrogenase family protein [Phycisphaerales bacterium]
MASPAAAKKPKVRSSGVTHYKMYIDGKFVDAKDRRTLEVFNPATEAAIATVPAGGPADIDAAAQAAKRAFYGGW